MKITNAVAAVAVLVGVVAEARPANAKPVWMPLGAGCANAIAVGPNNVPWVLGCGSGATDVFYLTGGPSPPPYLPTPPNCAAGSLYCPPEWVGAGFSGVTIAVDLNGDPVATNASGEVYQSLILCEGSSCTPTWYEAATGAVSSVVVGAQAGPDLQNLEGFEPVPPNWSAGWNGIWVQSLWGVGCGSNCGKPLAVNSSLFTGATTFFPFIDSPGEIFSGWTNMGYGGAGTQLALFTDPSGSQNPWVANMEGEVYSWDGEGWYAQLLPGQTAEQSSGEDSSTAVTSLTDHFALEHATAYYWTGTASGINAGWSSYITDFDTSPPGGFVDIVQIAYSQSITVGTSVYGPSTLWGIDRTGNIYYAQEPFITVFH